MRGGGDSENLGMHSLWWVLGLALAQLATGYQLCALPTPRRAGAATFHGGASWQPVLQPLSIADVGSRRRGLQRVGAANQEPEAAEETAPLKVTSKYTPDETRAIGNLVADDEWMGLTMEITELIRVAILEEAKKKGRDFLGKDNYKVGDISKELDARVKAEVALLRGKPEYELGDLSLALDAMSKELVCKMTGKDEYEFGDLSVVIDTRIKESVAGFCGKDEYRLGDLSVEVDRRIKKRVAEFTDKGEYQFGDISKEIERRRSQWVSNFLGSEEYKFGDISRKLATDFTGKDTYEFGYVTCTQGLVCVCVCVRARACIDIGDNCCRDAGTFRENWWTTSSANANAATPTRAANPRTQPFTLNPVQV